MEFSCTELDCGQPAQPTDGSVNVTSGTLTGATATYSCNLGYILSGSSTTTCGADGLWTSSVPSCNIVECGTLSRPANGGLVSPNTLYGNQATYSCNLGYILNGASTATCGADGSWDAAEPTCDVVDCGSPGTPPVNGPVITPSGTTFQQETVYSCDVGYTMVGTHIRVCQTEGSWNGSMPSCPPVDCGPLLAPNNGSIDLSTGTFFGMTAMYSCTPGYELQGSGTRTCLASGGWDGSQPYCTDIRAVHCKAYEQSPQSIVYMKSNSEVLPMFSLLQSASAINVVRCVRMCANLLREGCEESTACLLVIYNVNSHMCDLYHADANGHNVTCDASSECYAYEHYIYFM